MPIFITVKRLPDFLLLIGFAFLGLLWLPAPSAHAALYAYPVPRPDKAMDQKGQAQAQYRIFLDPARVKWIAWSTTKTTPTYEGHRVLNLPDQPGQLPAINFRLTNPRGMQSSALRIGSSERQSPFNDQLVLYGTIGSVPAISGLIGGIPSIVENEGAANEVINEGGIGYYRLKLNYLETEKENEPLFLLVELIDEHPPVGWGMTSQNNGLFNGSPEFGDHDGGDDDGGGSNGSHHEPHPTPEPVIPEPATWLLLCAGLGMSAWLTRRHRAHVTIQG